MAENDSCYKIKYGPRIGDVFWKIKNNVSLNCVFNLMSKFINKYKYIDYTLSIFDNITSNTIEIQCPISEMPRIVDYIYNLEHGTPLTFIGVNSSSKNYVVGMSISKGRIEFGNYKVENGKLKKIIME